MNISSAMVIEQLSAILSTMINLLDFRGGSSECPMRAEILRLNETPSSGLEQLAHDACFDMCEKDHEGASAVQIRINFPATRASDFPESS